MTDFYFIGIGGTAMASVAAALAKSGRRVSGSDANVYAPMSDFLSASGIAYFSGYDEKNIITAKPEKIVVGNAISRGNVELEFALDKKIPLVSMPEVVRETLIQRNTSIVVAGTHGKTTTASLLAWLMESVGASPGFLIGGIPENFGEGCRAPRVSSCGYFVTEGDEYDTAYFDKRSKFLHYRPDIAIVNNLEFDHADIFNSLDDIKLSFKRFANLIPRTGLLLVNADDANAHDAARNPLTTTQTFGLSEPAEWRAVDIHYTPESTAFRVMKRGVSAGAFISPLVGEHNVRNALAAISTLLYLGFEPEKIQAGLSQFKNVKRRLDTVASLNGIDLIDDFAHHPTAIRETLKAAAQKFPNRRLVACFEPRSNTTTRNIFQNELAACFELASVVALGAVNRPERYKPEERLDTDVLLREWRAQGKIAYASPLQMPTDYPEDIVSFIVPKLQFGDVILCMSNGSFGGLKERLKKRLVENSESHEVKREENAV
jgi:UDP-N-acetylmuramate: L-alanyl-gamma-D-glutamyl-meso-diaminopimelate ligase